MPCHKGYLVNERFEWVRPVQILQNDTQQLQNSRHGYYAPFPWNSGVNEGYRQSMEDF